MTNKYQRTIDRINSQKEAERAAIQKHIAAFSSLAPFIREFDGKVINARFTNKIKEATGRRFSLERNSLTYYANEAVIQSQRGWTYADRFRSWAFDLVLTEENRLNAAETAKYFNSQLDYLKAQYKKHEPNTEETLNYLTKMAELDKQIEELRRSTDSITRDISRNDFYNIKY